MYSIQFIKTTLLAVSLTLSSTCMGMPNEPEHLLNYGGRFFSVGVCSDTMPVYCDRIVRNKSVKECFEPPPIPGSENGFVVRCAYIDDLIILGINDFERTTFSVKPPPDSQQQPTQFSSILPSGFEIIDHQSRHSADDGTETKLGNFKIDSVWHILLYFLGGFLLVALFKLSNTSVLYWAWVLKNTLFCSCRKEKS